MDKTIRTLNQLRESLNGKIYVYLKDKKTIKTFFENAEAEGYLFGTTKPSESQKDNIVSLKKNKKLAYVGAVGKMEFQCNGGSNSEGKFHRIDYDRYINGYDDYYFVSTETRTVEINSHYHGKVYITGDKCEEAKNFYSVSENGIKNFDVEEHLLNLLADKYKVVIGCDD